MNSIEQKPKETMMEKLTAYFSTGWTTKNKVFNIAYIIISAILTVGVSAWMQHDHYSNWAKDREGSISRISVVTEGISPTSTAPSSPTSVSSMATTEPNSGNQSPPSSYPPSPTLRSVEPSKLEQELYSSNSAELYTTFTKVTGLVRELSSVFPNQNEKKETIDDFIERTALINSNMKTLNDSIGEELINVPDFTPENLQQLLKRSFPEIANGSVKITEKHIISIRNKINDSTIKKSIILTHDFRRFRTRISYQPVMRADLITSDFIEKFNEEFPNNRVRNPII